MITLNAIGMVFPPSPENQWMAERLKKELSSYRIPSAVQKRTGIRKVEEAGTPVLIVFCMPESVHDPEVEAEIDRFRAAGLSNRIIALILGGAPGERFPEGLLHETLPDGTVTDREPLAANIAAPTRRGMLKKLETEKLRIIASILGVAFDDLRNRRRRQRMRIAAAAGTVLFCGAAAFLFYAVSRVRVMSEQQTELSRQLEQIQTAQKEEERRKDEEEEAFAGRIAVEARNAMENGDRELALLLCLDLLPEMRRVDALTDALRESLEGLCGRGYVSVTDADSYVRDRFGTEAYGFFHGKKDTPPERFPEKLYPVPPEELKCGEGYGSAYLEAYSGKQDCAVYTAHFTPLSGEEISVSWVHFPETPEQDYYLRDRRGEDLILKKLAFLPGGTFIGVGYTDDLAYRVRTADGEILPFFEEETEGIQETDSGGTVLLHKVGSFQMFEGTDVVFGCSSLYHQSEGYYTEVYAAEPFRYLETLENVNRIEEQKGTEYLFGSRLGRIPLSVYTKDPFSHCLTLKAGSEEKVSQYPVSTAVRLPDGRTVLLYHDDCVYTLPEGELLYDFHGKDFAGLRRVSDGLSSEGWAVLTIREESVFWDTAAGREAGRIPYQAPEYPAELVNTFCGPEDETSGRRSASAYCMGGMVWEYREKDREVPEDLEGQISLAEEFLRGRELTKKERNKYHLDRETGIEN